MGKQPPPSGSEEPKAALVSQPLGEQVHFSGAPGGASAQEKTRGQKWLGKSPLVRLPGPRWVWWAVGIGVVVVWGLADVRLRGLPWPDRPLEHKTDFTVYTAAGRAFFTGENPYEVTNPRGWKYVYPPLFALLVSPLSLLPMPEQCLVWYFLSVLFCWGCYRECSRIVAELRRQDRFVAHCYPRWFPRLGVLAFGAALFPTLNCLQRGQVGVLKLYLLLLGVRWIWQSRHWMGRAIGGIALAGSVVLKLTPVFVVGVLLGTQLAELIQRFLSRIVSKSEHLRPFPANLEANTPPQAIPQTWSGFLAAAGGVMVGLLVFVFVIPGLVVGWKANLNHLAYWYNRVVKSAGEGVAIPNAAPGGSVDKLDENAFGGNHRTVRNQSLANAIFRSAAFVDYMFLGGPYDRLLDDDCAPPTRVDTPLYQIIQKTTRGVVLAAILAAAWALGASGGMLSQSAAFGLGCVGMLVLSPLSWGHYFMFLAPGVLFIPLWLDRAGWRRTAPVLAVLPPLLSVAHYAFLTQAGRIGLLGWGTTCWLLTASGLILLSWRRDLAATPSTSGSHSGSVQKPGAGSEGSFPKEELLSYS